MESSQRLAISRKCGRAGHKHHARKKHGTGRKAVELLQKVIRRILDSWYEVPRGDPAVFLLSVG